MSEILLKICWINELFEKKLRSALISSDQLRSHISSDHISAQITYQLTDNHISAQNKLDQLRPSDSVRLSKVTKMQFFQSSAKY